MVNIGYQCFYYLSNEPCMNLITQISVGYQVYARKFIKSLSGSNFFVAITQYIESFCYPNNFGSWLTYL